MKVRWLAGAAFAAICSASAWADPPDMASVVRIACAGITDAKDEREVPTERIAEAILFDSGVPASRLMGGRTLSPQEYRVALLAAVQDPPSDVDVATREMIGQYVLELGQDLSPGSSVSAKARGLKLLSVPPSDLRAGWLFVPANAVRIACMPVKPSSSTPVIDRFANSNAPSRMGLTKAIADLSTTGDERKKADSATIGMKIDKTTDDDGNTKRTTTLSFDGTLGVRVTGDHASTPGFVFANYTLSRARIKPEPPLDPGKHRDDDDTNGLELGATLGDIALPYDLSLAATGGYVLDFVKRSRRATGSFVLDSGYTPDLGLCKLGMLKLVSLAGIDFRTECTFQVEADYSHVFKVGRADFKDRGDFVAIGLFVNFQIVPPVFDKSGIVANVSYRYLPTVSGIAPDVKRWDAGLKYRWWLPQGAAVDFGGTYKHGEELKTYTHENSIELTLGLLY